ILYLPRMSEQEVTYSELKFHSPTQQQSRQRAEITKNKDSPSPLWRLFAVIFGILCLALLVTSGLLGALGDKCIICPKNWIQHGKDCYELSSGIKSWSYCSSLGSRLLKIDSKEELVESILLFI
uniref:Uncharacterized protein n=1 Tax=Chelonoidis abingdonii TaxID=106734 RepID=A0A8C0G5Q6_CHEAB